MILDNSFSYQNLPFELHLCIKHAFYKQSFGSVTHSHVEVLHKGELVGSTPSSHPNWNFTVTLRLIHLESNEPVEFRLFSKNTIVLHNPINLITAKKVEESFQSKMDDPAYCHRGSITTTIESLLVNQEQDTSYNLLKPKSKNEVAAVLIVSTKPIKNDIFHIHDTPSIVKKLSNASEGNKRMLAYIHSTLDDNVFMLQQMSNWIETHSEALTDADLFHTLQDYISFIETNVPRKKDRLTIRVPSSRFPHSPVGFHVMYCAQGRNQSPERQSLLLSIIKEEFQRIQLLNNDHLKETKSKSFCFDSVIGCHLLLSPNKRVQVSDGFGATMITCPDTKRNNVKRFQFFWKSFVDYVTFIKYFRKLIQSKSAVTESTSRYSRFGAFVLQDHVPTPISICFMDNLVHITATKRSAYGEEIEEDIWSGNLFHIVLLFRDLHYMDDTSVLEISIQKLASNLLKSMSDKCQCKTILQVFTDDSDQFHQLEVMHGPGQVASSIKLLSSTARLTLPDISKLHPMEVARKVTLRVHQEFLNSKDKSLRPCASIVHLPLLGVFGINQTGELKKTNSKINAQIIIPDASQPFICKLFVYEMVNLLAVDSNGLSDPYFIVYLADHDGNYIPYQSKSGKNPKDKASSIEVYRSKSIPKNLNPNFQQLVTIEGTLDDPSLANWQYISIEVWDKNLSRSDICLGEVLLPIFSLNFHLQEDEKISTYQIQPSKKMVDRQHQNLGSILLSVHFLYLPSTASELSNDTQQKLDISFAMRDIHITDYCWPARILSSNVSTGIVDTPLFVFPTQKGLYIEACTVSGLDDSWIKIFCDCLEQVEDFTLLKDLIPYQIVYQDSSNNLSSNRIKGNAEEIIRLLVPYNQIDMDNLAVIGPHSCTISVICKRVMDGNGKKKRTSISEVRTGKVRELEFDVIVGPCLAENLCALIHSYASTMNYLDALVQLTDNVDAEDVQTFDSLLYDNEQIIFEQNTTIEAIKKHSQHVEVESIFASIFEELHHAKLLMAPALTVGRYNLQKCSFEALRCFLIVEIALKRLKSLESIVLSHKHLNLLTYLTPEITVENVDNKTIEVQIQSLIKSIMDGMVSITDCPVKSKIEEWERALEEMTFCLRMVISLSLRRGFSLELIRSQIQNLVHTFYVSFMDILVSIIGDQLMTRPSNGSGGIVSREYSFEQNEVIHFILARDLLFVQHIQPFIFFLNFSFREQPLLTRCLSFDHLLYTFNTYMKDNIETWSLRAIERIMTMSKNTSQENNSSIPWEIVTLSNPHQPNSSLLSSEIPETIQIQLNIQIGLKIIPNNFNDMNCVNVRRVFEANKMIAAGIARTYWLLAVEYVKTMERILFDNKNTFKNDKNQLHHFEVMFQTIASHVAEIGVQTIKFVPLWKREFGHNPAAPSTASNSDDLFCFIISAINDVERILQIHIPQSIQIFTDAYPEESDAILFSSGSFNKLCTKGSFQYIQSESLSEAAKHFVQTFSKSYLLLKKVTNIGINHLCNQLLLYSELKDILLLDIRKLLFGRDTSGDNSRYLNFPLAHVIAQKLAALNHDADKSPSDSESVTSPVEIIVATLMEFYNFLQLNTSQQIVHKVMWTCNVKFFFIYLVALRDLLHQFGSKGILGSILQFTEAPRRFRFNVNHNYSHSVLNKFQIAMVLNDLKVISAAHSEIDDLQVQNLIRFFNTTAIDVVSENIGVQRLEEILVSHFNDEVYTNCLQST